MPGADAQGFYCIALNTLPYPYTAEILPFNLRAKGLAMFVCVQNVAISFNQFVTPIALEVRVQSEMARQVLTN